MDPASKRPTFVRRKPSFAVQCVIAGCVYGVATPGVWLLQRAGLAERFFGAFGDMTKRRIAENNPFGGYTPGAQDVFVMTLPKCGTNWMMQIVHQLIWHGKGEYDHIHDVVPWPDILAMPRFMHAYAIPLEQADHWRSSPEGRRVIKTHFSWELLPYSEEARYIAVIRDPKDVFVSSYFFIKDGIYGPAMPSVETWYKLFLSGRSLMGASWPEQTASYWAQRNRPNVLILSFKSMKRDLARSVSKVADFLSIRLTDELLKRVVELSSFEYMKSVDHKFNMGKLVAGRQAGAMIRKGTQGGSAELLSPSQQKEIDAACKDALTRLGCDLPYEEFCDPA